MLDDHFTITVTKDVSAEQNLIFVFALYRIEITLKVGTLMFYLQAVDEAPLRLYFLENHIDNFMAFEIEPKDADVEGDIEAVIKYYTENTSAADGLVTKTLVRECKFIITAEQVSGLNEKQN